MSESELIEVGYVAKAHGLGGEVRVRLHNEHSELLEQLEQVYVRGPSTASQRVLAIDSVRGRGAQPIVGFKGCSDRNAADQLVGATVWVSRSALPVLEDDEYYHVDLIGLRVLDEADQEIGRVVDVYSLPANDALVVHGGPNGELLVPVIEHFVGPVDLKAGTVKLRHLHDLLEPEQA